MMRMRARAQLVLVLTALAGCLRQTQPGETEIADRPVGTAPITIEEIVSSGLLGSTALDVIQRLRPTFLIDRTAIRGSTQPITVSINGGQPRTTIILQSTPAATVQEIKYLSKGEAAVKFGDRANGPVILVMLRAQPPS